MGGLTSPQVFGRTVNPISKKGGRLCSPQYYNPPPKFLELETALIDSYMHEDCGRSYKAYIAVAVNVSIDLQIFDLHQGGTYLPKIPYCCN